MPLRFQFAAPHPPTPHCDFCHAAGEPLAACPCRPFTLLFVRRGDALLVRLVGGVATRHRPEPGEGEVAAFCSLGGWAACPACAARIDAGDAPGLARRMLERQADRALPPAHRAAIARQVEVTVRGFWSHRPPLN